MDLIKQFLFLLLTMMVTVSGADEWQHLFESGNEYYRNGQYDQAIAEYETILNYGYSSGELYFNLGNAYYKMNELGLARLNYERAGMYLKGDEALRQNLRMVELRLVDQIESPPRLFLQVWWESLVNLFTLQTLTILVVILLWLVLFLAGYRLFLIRRMRKDSLRPFFIFFLIVFIFFSTLLVQKIYNFETEEYGVILSQTVSLYSEPADTSTELFVLHEGSKVEILRSAGDWHEIRLVDGKTGWISRSALEII